MVWYLNAIWILASLTIWIPDKWTPSCFLIYWSGIQMVSQVHKTFIAHRLTIWILNHFIIEPRKVQYLNVSSIQMVGIKIPTEITPEKQIFCSSLLVLRINKLAKTVWNQTPADISNEIENSKFIDQFW